MCVCCVCVCGGWEWEWAVGGQLKSSEGRVGEVKGGGGGGQLKTADGWVGGWVGGVVLASVGNGPTSLSTTLHPSPLKALHLAAGRQA